MLITVRTCASMIDHSLLNPAMTDQDLEMGLQLALKYEVASVCIKPYYVSRASSSLKGSNVAVGTVISFPHGGHETTVKVFEAEKAIAAGARELDIVVNIGKVLSGDWEYVKRDLAEVLYVCKQGKALTKVIFENCLLKNEHKILLCKICDTLEADFVKTSTSYSTGGATDADLILMRANVSSKVQVKAAGGVRTFSRLVEVMRLGVTRVGATATEAILKEASEVLSDGMESEELYTRINPTGLMPGY